MSRIYATIFALGLGLVIVGCHASADVDNDPNTTHKQVQEKTVTDANGNVISQEKTSEKY